MTSILMYLPISVLLPPGADTRWGRGPLAAPANPADALRKTYTMARKQVVSLSRVIGTKTGLFFRCFRRVSPVIGTRPFFLFL